jgi:hypothetical protein
MKNKDYLKYGKVISVRMDPQLYHRYKMIAVEQQRSLTDITSTLILSYINHYNKKKGRK